MQAPFREFGLPIEGPNMLQARCDFCEERVERRLGFEIHVPHLTRCSQIEVLEKVQGDYEERDDDSSILSTRCNDGDSGDVYKNIFKS